MHEPGARPLVRRQLPVLRRLPVLALAGQHRYACADAPEKAGPRARRSIIHLVGEEQHEPGHAVRQAALAAGWSHRHRDVSGGWLRPTVFGAVDGLVTNTSLIAGLGGGGVSAHTVILTGVAALVAGAFSMGTGEYVSVTNQNELVGAEVATERIMQLASPPPRRPSWPRPSPVTAPTRRPRPGWPPRYPPTPTPRCACTPARSSASTRSSCRRPWSRASVADRLLRGGAHPAAALPGGPSTLAAALAVAAVALLTGGMVVGRLTGRPLLASGLRQLALGAVAVGVTFAVGSLIGGGHAV